MGGKNIWVIPKIENQQGIKNLTEIIACSTPSTSARGATSSLPGTTSLSSPGGRRALGPPTPSGFLQTNTMASLKLQAACQLRRVVDVLNDVEMSCLQAENPFWIFLNNYQMMF